MLAFCLFICLFIYYFPNKGLHSRLNLCPRGASLSSWEMVVLVMIRLGVRQWMWQGGEDGRKLGAPIVRMILSRGTYIPPCSSLRFSAKSHDRRWLGSKGSKKTCQGQNWNVWLDRNSNQSITLRERGREQKAGGRHRLEAETQAGVEGLEPERREWCLRGVPDQWAHSQSFPQAACSLQPVYVGESFGLLK